MSDLESKIRSFSELKQNWDSYGSMPISKIAIDKAIALLPWLREKFTNIWACPTSIGGVGFEFETEEYDVMIDVKPWKP